MAHVVDGGFRRHRGGLLDTGQPHRPHHLAGAPIDGSFSVGGLLLGLMVHMAMSVLFGVILAALVGRLAGTLPALLAAGMAFGLAVWLVNQYVTWPAIDQTAAQAFTPWVLAVGHLLFGLVTAVLVGRLPAHRGLGRQLPA